MKDRVFILASLSSSLLVFRGALIESLLDSGLEVHVAAPALSTDLVASKLLDKGVFLHDVKLKRAGMNPISDIRTLLDILRLIKTVQPKYFLGYTVKPVIYGLLAARLSRVPHRYALITGLGYAFTGEGRGKRGVALQIVRALYKIALVGAHKVFFQNSDDMKLFRQLNLIPGKVPSVVANGSGIDVEQFSVAPLTANQISFLLIARLLGDKGVREYIYAARKLKIKHPDVRFVLVGWIDENPDAIEESELNSWIAEKVVDFAGRLEDVRPAIMEASVYVLPSYREGTPRTVLEAMSMGRAVITTDAPGCRETVVDGVNGFLVPVKDSDKLAEAMERFILEPVLIRRLGQRSREIAEKKYDVRKVNAFMLREMGITS